ncbi:MAG TPA: flagellar hook-associated protein FlgK [Clostridiaceae bacterium]|nr:flagellar hook-associated protein FlgK [Clostridiaceae bacterium]
MHGSFFGLGIAARGLTAAQRNLDVLSHNISNVNTPGYTRQQAVQTASQPLISFDGTGMIGTGSQVSEVIRVRDEYLDYKFWSESVFQGEWDIKRQLLSELEAAFNEPSDGGFSKVLDEYFSALQELSKDPSAPATRALVKEKGISVARYFNNLAYRLEKMQHDVNQNVYIKVEEINSLASQISKLNQQIYVMEVDGNNANDLRDRRELLVDKLSKIVNIEAYEIVRGKLPSGKDDKYFVVSIGGKPIVNHFELSELKVHPRDEKLNAEDINNLFEIKWADGSSINITGGELKGYLDVRDGNSGLNDSPLFKGIPHYINKLNTFVRTFAMALNEGYCDNNANGIIEPDEDLLGHADGFWLDSVEGELPSGIRFFTMLDRDGNPMDSMSFMGSATTIDEIVSRYDGITAKNFSVSADVLDNISKISTSVNAGEKGNAKIIEQMLKMRSNTHMFSEGNPEDYMKSLIATLGVDSQQAVKYSDNQNSIIKMIQNRRMSVSGVSVDEEMANMIKFQHAYSAAAKIINTYMELYDILINRVGL